MNMQPLISVIIPTYQRPEKLTRALSSIAAATTQGCEVIVIDDCKEGSGFAPARLAGARYMNKAGVNRGLSASRNLGLDLATGSYVVFLDDDDYFAPQGLDLLFQCAVENNAALTYGDYATFNQQMLTQVSLTGITLDAMLVCNRIPVGAYLLHRASVSRRFDERLRSHEDWEFILDLFDRVRTAYVPQTVAMIDKTENESTSMQARRQSHFWLDFLSIYARFPAQHLALARSNMLQSLGIVIPEAMLGFLDEI